MRSNDACDSIPRHFVHTMQNYFLPSRMKLGNVAVDMYIFIFENDSVEIIGTEC